MASVRAISARPSQRATPALKELPLATSHGREGEGGGRAPKGGDRRGTRRENASAVHGATEGRTEPASQRAAAPRDDGRPEQVGHTCFEPSRIVRTEPCRPWWALAGSTGTDRVTLEDEAPGARIGPSWTGRPGELSTAGHGRRTWHTASTTTEPGSPGGAVLRPDRPGVGTDGPPGAFAVQSDDYGRRRPGVLWRFRVVAGRPRMPWPERGRGPARRRPVGTPGRGPARGRKGAQGRCRGELVELHEAHEAHEARRLGRQRARARARAGGLLGARFGHGNGHAYTGPRLSGRGPVYSAAYGDGDGDHEDGAQGDDEHERRTVGVEIGNCHRLGYRRRHKGADLRGRGSARRRINRPGHAHDSPALPAAGVGHGLRLEGQIAPGTGECGRHGTIIAQAVVVGGRRRILPGPRFMLSCDGILG